MSDGASSLTALAAGLARNDQSRAETHQLRVQLAVAQLAGFLRMKREAGHGAPVDDQLFAALDRWAAGELT